MQTLETPSLKDFPTLKAAVLANVENKIAEAFLLAKPSADGCVVMAIQADKFQLVAKR